MCVINASNEWLVVKLDVVASTHGMKRNTLRLAASLSVGAFAVSEGFVDATDVSWAHWDSPSYDAAQPDTRYSVIKLA